MMIAGISVPSVFYVVGHAIVSELAPVSQRGAMLAINNAAGNSAGLFAAYLMGHVVQSARASAADGYHKGFLTCGLVALICVIGMMFLQPEREANRFAANRSRDARWQRPAA